LRSVVYPDGLKAEGDELIALQAATQAKLDALMPSVLDQVFRGELWQRKTSRVLRNP
jgi:hypothetical protein